jgi:hypothetical protein
MTASGSESKRLLFASCQARNHDMGVLLRQSSNKNKDSHSITVELPDLVDMMESRSYTCRV